MSLQQLTAMKSGNPRRELLEQLFEAESPLPDAMSRMAALHVADKKAAAELRTITVQANDRYFPHHKDVPALVLLFFKKLHGLWSDCKNPKDDLFVASFCMYGVSAIHPFENGNGRTSVDMGQYVLMLRWNLPYPPLALPKDAHRMIASYVAALDDECDGKSAESFYELRQSLADYLDGITLSEIKETVPFQIVTDWLEQALTEGAMPSLEEEGSP